MISTFYLLQFIAFYLWQATSKHARRDHNAVLPLTDMAIRHKQIARIISAVLLVAATVGFILKVGLMSGVCASLVGLMGVGCLSVVIAPFRYMHLSGLITLYILSVLLEIFI